MKKKTIANVIMIAVILAIAIAGILTAGHIQGWFDKVTPESALLTELHGVVNMEREDVVYPVEKDTVLRAGDIITCDTGATAVISMEKTELTLGEQAEVKIITPEVSSFSAEVKTGEVFVNTSSAITLSFDGKEQEFSNTVASLSVRFGAQSASVFEGSVADAKAGQMLSWVGGSLEIRELSIDSLNDFNIAQIRCANQTKTLCFTNLDLDKLEQMRMDARKEEAERKMALERETEPAETAATETTTEPTSESTEGKTPEHGEPPASIPTNPPQGTVAPPASSVPQETAAPPETTAPETEPPVTVTLSIYCDTILNNWDKLEPAKAPYVPSSGVILSTEVEITPGETVLDVLKRICSAYGISLEYSWTPLYNSYYVEGINNLYEFDCGSDSGWMYKVNGWFPNYGCSAYTLSGGENIVWCYTCTGLGADVGGGSW